MQKECTLYAWGNDEDGQLGLGKNRGPKFYSQIKVCHYKLNFMQISCGKDHTALIGQNGHLYTMGSNQYAKLGYQTNSITAAPQRVDGLSKFKIVQVSCGYNHTACVSSEGFGFLWGDNQYGQLGLKQQTKEITRLPISELKMISCGNYHTLCLNISGEVFSFGLGEQGQLGIGKIKCCTEPTRLNVEFAKQIVAANYFSLILSKDGSALACGDHYGTYPQKINYKCKFSKLDAKNVAAGLTLNSELIFFDLDEQLRNVRDFAIGETMGIAVGDKCYQWDIEKQLIGKPKIIEQLTGKHVNLVSAGSSFYMCCSSQEQDSIVSNVSSTATITIRNKATEERSKSGYSVDPKITQLEKQLEEKDLLIMKLKQDNQMLQQKNKDQFLQLTNKDSELKQLKQRVLLLEQENQELKMKHSTQQILHCEMESDDSFGSPQKLEDSLQKQNQGCKTEQDLRYKSFEKLRLKSDALQENRPQSQMRDRKESNSTQFQPQYSVQNQEKSNLSTIKNRLTDLQKNKEQLEQRMKQFESRLRENKTYQK